MGDGGESMKMELGGFELGFVLVNIPNSGNSFKIDGKILMKSTNQVLFVV